MVGNSVCVCKCVCVCARYMTRILHRVSGKGTVLEIDVNCINVRTWHTVHLLTKGEHQLLLITKLLATTRKSCLLI